jgi:hypothetical protein
VRTSLYWGIGERRPREVAVSISCSKRLCTEGWVSMSMMRACMAVPVVSAPASSTRRISARMYSGSKGLFCSSRASMKLFCIFPLAFSFVG